MLSRDIFYILGVLNPCYTVEHSTDSTDSTLSQVTPTHASNRDDFPVKSFLHQKMNGIEKKLSNNSIKHSISKRQLQGGPLTKQEILETYSDVFMELGSFQDCLTISNSNQMQNPLDMHLGKCLYTCKTLSMRKSGIWND